MIDGLPVVMNSDMSATASTNAPNLAMFDRVEVPDGLAGVYGGFGSPGGVYQPRAQAAPYKLTSIVDASVDTRGNLLGMVGVGGRLNEAGSIRGRLVASSQNRNLDQRSAWGQDQAFYGPIEADLTGRTLLRMAQAIRICTMLGPAITAAAAICSISRR